jgi:hypothetical protein
MDPSSASSASARATKRGRDSGADRDDPEAGTTKRARAPAARATKRGRDSGADRDDPEAGTTKRARAPGVGRLPLSITVTTGGPLTWKSLLPPLARDQLGMLIRQPVTPPVVTTPNIPLPPGASLISVDTIPVPKTTNPVTLPEWGWFEILEED